MATHRKRVVITGSDGLIGSILMDAWRHREDIEPIGLARKAGPNADVLADTTDLDNLIGAFRGADAVVHLAATSAVESPWDAILNSNLVGTYNAYEAARVCGVDQVVYASSNHAVGTFETDHVPTIWDIDDERQIDETSEPLPDSLYGVSKVYGEAVARYYADHHGVRSVCLRIGGCRGADDPSHPRNLWKSSRDGEEGIREARRRMRAVWLSERDCVQLIEKALTTDLNYVVCFGISDNPRKIWSIDHARKVLGYDPQDVAPEEIFPGER